MPRFYFDKINRFAIEDFASTRPFASFLPGLAGPLGIPMWVFYVNRGQAIAGFGVESKDNPIMEFQPANKAYQTTPYTGFRTFLKLKKGTDSILYEPFSPWQSADATTMFVSMNELELQATNSTYGLQTNVLYFTLPGENFAGLVRQVTLTNLGAEPVVLEILDGLPWVMPYGVNNQFLKEIGRTIEAWMAVFNLEQNIPFYHFQASAGDTAEVADIEAGHFYLTFAEQELETKLLAAIVDPALIFGHNTTLHAPDRFMQLPLATLQTERQTTTGKTPCGFFGLSATLAPSASLTLSALIGHVSNLDDLRRQQNRLTSATYLRQKRDEANRLVAQLTDVVNTHTASPIFDAYCRQTFLDNILRGGWPLLLGREDSPFVYHLYSRKHGDLERDYNAFYLAAEPYSQGNGNYRDVNQNRRSDVLLNPAVADFNILTFLGLIQADGYNPLVVKGSRFTVSAANYAPLLALVEQPDKLQPVLAQPFTPGQLLKTITDRHIGLTVSPEAFVAAVLAQAEQHFEAAFGEGYWIDHWFYNLDLIDAYLAVYPDRKDELLFAKAVVPFFDNPAVVQPRAQKYVLVDGKVRQYGAVVEDEEKAALLTARAQTPNLARTAHGHGDVYRTTVFAKLVGLALVKFATLDPLGMGLEMEAGKPGWYDALNGLPGLFGSSLGETYELQRLLTFLLDALADKGEVKVNFPVEQELLLHQVVQALDAWIHSTAPNRDHLYWDTVAAARETYRQRTRLGFADQTTVLTCAELALILTAFRAKVHAGIERALALNNGLPPTYFTYTAADYELITGDDGVAQRDKNGRPYVTVKRFEPIGLPLFLEGPMHALKVQPDAAAARQLYYRVKTSDLFDRQLKMYKVNASLAGQSHEIGRARAFTPGWLENESIWLHMAYKYLLETLKAGLYEEFFTDFKNGLIPFQTPEIYGRSPLENSSFIVSSAHPDESLHGAGFVARLSGATAEFLSIWLTMLAGPQPFFMQNGQLCLAFKPALPGWLFDEHGTVTFTFLGSCTVVYHNPAKLDTFTGGGLKPRSLILHPAGGPAIELAGDSIGPPYAEMVRAGQVKTVQVSF